MAFYEEETLCSIKVPTLETLNDCTTSRYIKSLLNYFIIKIHADYLFVKGISCAGF